MKKAAIMNLILNTYLRLSNNHGLLCDVRRFIVFASFKCEGLAKSQNQA